MKKNISANLNFVDSLSDFQEYVTKLLDFKNIEEWSGRIVIAVAKAIRTVRGKRAFNSVFVILLLS